MKYQSKLVLPAKLLDLCLNKKSSTLDGVFQSYSHFTIEAVFSVLSKLMKELLKIMHFCSELCYPELLNLEGELWKISGMSMWLRSLLRNNVGLDSISFYGIGLIVIITFQVRFDREETAQKSIIYMCVCVYLYMLHNATAGITIIYLCNT